MRRWRRITTISTAFAVAVLAALGSAMTVRANPPVGGRWAQSGEVYYWTLENGALLTDDVTPDGYYVNPTGFWQAEKREYLGASTVLPDQFVGSAAQMDMRACQEAVRLFDPYVQKIFGGKRAFRLYEDRIAYCQVSGKKDAVLFSLYKDAGSGGWKVKISCRLETVSPDKITACGVDYVVLQYLLSLVSHTPEYAADAIFQSWMGKNGWNIQSKTKAPVGDCMMSYAVEDGAAVYQITRRSGN